jgi:hypothetical protein
LVVDSRQVDDDRVSLTDDFRFGDTQGVDSFPDALDGEIETLGVELPDRFLGDRDASLEVETERRFVSGDQVSGQRAKDDDDETDECESETATGH